MPAYGVYIGDPRDCHVVIVDDLVQTGGTLMECAKVTQQAAVPPISLSLSLSLSLSQVVQEAGAVAVSVFVTHPVFPGNAWHKFKAGQSPVPFANVWVTDSLPQARDLEGHPPFKVLSLCDVIADSLLGYDLLSRNI